MLPKSACAASPRSCASSPIVLRRSATAPVGIGVFLSTKARSLAQRDISSLFSSLPGFPRVVGSLRRSISRNALPRLANALTTVIIEQCAASFARDGTLKSSPARHAAVSEGPKIYLLKLFVMLRLKS